MAFADARHVRGARDGRGGFALLEVMIALSMIALIAAVAMPGLVRPAGSGVLRIAAMEVTALLRDARSRALADGRQTAATATGDEVRSAGFAVTMPPGTAAGPAGTVIRFTPDVRASGGPLLLAARSGLYIVGIDPTTGAIDVTVH